MGGLGEIHSSPWWFSFVVVGWVWVLAGERVGRLYGEMEAGGIMAAEERHG